MGVGDWSLPDRISALPAPLRYRLQWLLSTGLVALGVLFILAAGTYAAYTLTKTWIMEQDRYLVGDDIAPLPVDLGAGPPLPTAAGTGLPNLAPGPATTSLPITSSPSSTPQIEETASGAGVPLTATRPRPAASSTATPLLSNMPSPTPTPSSAGLASPSSSATPASAGLPSPSPSAILTPASGQASPPVKIQIPALKITRSIITLPRKLDRRTGAWTWNTQRLFRPGRKDLVGYSEGSAYPGQEGNMILVGHNYGYGYNGVFVRLGRLKAGNKVHVVNKAGQTFTYQVETVSKVKWRSKSFGELTQHLSFLATAGPERLTLVSCSGADVEPFPERIYVVAKPVK